jgi:hypothetical protein
MTILPNQIPAPSRYPNCLPLEPDADDELRYSSILAFSSNLNRAISNSREQARLSGGPGESYLDSTLVWHSTLIQTLREYVDTCG